MTTPNLWDKRLLRDWPTTNSIEIGADIGRGITRPRWATCNGVDSVIKASHPAYGGQDTRREYASWRFAKFFNGLVNIAPTIIRNPNTLPYGAANYADGRPVAIVARIPNAQTIDDFSLMSRAMRSDLIGVATFDFIVGNQDRHGGNLLYSNNRLWAIDHGFTFTGNFPSSIALATVRGSRIPAYIKSHLRGMLAQSATVVETLAPILGDDRPVRNMLTRADVLLRETTF